MARTSKQVTGGIACPVILCRTEKDLTAVKMQHMGGIGERSLHIVGDHDDGHTRAVVAADDAVKLRRDHRVETGDRLIQQKHPAGGARQSSTRCC